MPSLIVSDFALILGYTLDSLSTGSMVMSVFTSDKSDISIGLGIVNLVIPSLDNDAVPTYVKFFGKFKLTKLKQFDIDILPMLITESGSFSVTKFFILLIEPEPISCNFWHIDKSSSYKSPSTLFNTDSVISSRFIALEKSTLLVLNTPVNECIPIVFIDSPIVMSRPFVPPHRLHRLYSIYSMFPVYTLSRVACSLKEFLSFFKSGSIEKSNVPNGLSICWLFDMLSIKSLGNTL